MVTTFGSNFVRADVFFIQKQNVILEEKNKLWITTLFLYTFKF